MQTSSALASLLLCALLAGCVGTETPSASGASSTAAPSTAAEPTQVPGDSSVLETRQLQGETRTNFDLSGCLNPRMLFVLDPASAQALLPPGFVAADVTGLLQFTGTGLESPIPAGQAVGGYDFLSCSEDSLTGGAAAFSQVGILVQPPNLGNRTPVEKTAYDLYLLALHVNQPAWQGLALRSGFTVEEAPLATIASSAQEVAGGQHQGTGSVAVGSPLGSATYVIPSAGNDLDFRARYWHVGANGTFYVEFRLKETVRAGAILSCSHADGSAFAKVSGTTSCTTQSRFAAVGLGTSIQGTAFWIPGIFPAT